jgi:L-2-hydroxyglutarate oxidase LhgO
MTTVIIGGGIIGTSIAYHLSNSSSASKEAEVHVIDSSARVGLRRRVSCERLV